MAEAAAPLVSSLLSTQGRLVRRFLDNSPGGGEGLVGRQATVGASPGSLDSFAATSLSPPIQWREGWPMKVCVSFSHYQ